MQDLFKNLDRNNKLRKQILNSFVAGLMTDDERANFYNLPEGCRIRENAKIISPEKFECGKYVWIGEGAILDASGGLSIGDHTSIGLNVMIWSHTSFLANISMENKIESNLIARAKTTIGKGCFIAGPSVIYHGVEIGDRTIVMPMSVVNKNLPGNCIAGGSPARVISTIDDNFVEQQIKKFKDAGQL